MVMNEFVKDGHQVASRVNKWRDFSDTILKEGNLYTRFGGIPLIVMPADYFNTGAANLYEAIFMYAGRTHTYGWHAFWRIPGGHFRHFVTRYSAYIWDLKIRPVEDSEKKLAVEPAGKIFDKKHFFKKALPDGKLQYIIHLINPPYDQRISEDPVGYLPKPLFNLKCTVTIPKGYKVTSVNLLTPDSRVWQHQLDHQDNSDKCRFQIRELKFWNIAIVNFARKGD